MVSGITIIPHIKFLTPRTDAVKESPLTTEFKQHVKNAQDEHYLATMKQAKESLTKSETSTSRYGHYPFDFAQMLQVPHHARL